jgi:hypothetical protein
MALWRERIDPELLHPSAEGAHQLLTFVMGYIDKYRTAPTFEVVEKEFGIQDFELNAPEQPVEFIIDQLRERHQWQRFRSTMSELSHIENSSLEVVQEALQLGFNEFGQILRDMSPKSTSLSNEDALQARMRYEADKAAREAGLFGLTTGFKEIDTHIGGLRGLSFVVAQMKTYKSWLQLVCGVGNYFNDKNVMYYALEPSKEEIQDRAICMMAQLDWTDFDLKRLTKEQDKKFDETMEWMLSTENKFYFEQPEPGKRTIPYLHELAKDKGVDIVLIDQFYDIESTRRGESHWIEKSYILGEMAVMAEDIPVFCSAQLNRQDDVGLTIHIEQKASLVMDIFCPKELKDQGLLHYGMRHARNSYPKTWEVQIQLNPWSNFRVISEVHHD